MMAARPGRENTPGSSYDKNEFVKNFEKRVTPKTLTAPASRNPLVTHDRAVSKRVILNPPCAHWRARHHRAAGRTHALSAGNHNYECTFGSVRLYSGDYSVLPWPIQFVTVTVCHRQTGHDSLLTFAAWNPRQKSHKSVPVNGAISAGRWPRGHQNGRPR